MRFPLEETLDKLEKVRLKLDLVRTSDNRVDGLISLVLEQNYIIASYLEYRMKPYMENMTPPASQPPDNA